MDRLVLIVVFWWR